MNHTFDSLVDFAALSLLPTGGRRAAVERLRSGEPARSVFERLVGGAPADRRGRGAALRPRASAAVDRALGSGIQVVPLNDPMFPAALYAIADPPPVLWVRGDPAALSRPAVAIVGARAASQYGLAVAGRLAADLAGRGVVVVSGLARGIDSAAHRGAVDTRGGTIAVLGSGPDVIYPPEHDRLADEVAASGAVVSELLPGTAPQRRFFPMRNRVISGVSRAVVVIEAGEKSGSLITARCALDQGRDVLAVPGNVLSGRNRGGHGLLRDGAKIVESADDILEELGEAVRRPAGSRAHGDRGLSPTADPILDAMPAGEPCDLDAISERSGVIASRLLPRLLDLELQGFVKRAGGGWFVRVDRTC